jgi:hypothetical protein
VTLIELEMKMKEMEEGIPEGERLRRMGNGSFL